MLVQELTSLGFLRIELTGNIVYETDIEAKVLDLQTRYGVDFLIHNYLPFQPEDFVLNLASTQDQNHTRSVEHLRRSIQLSANLGKDLYTIHPGFLYDLVAELEDDFFMRASDGLNSRETFYATLRDAVQSLAPPPFKLAVENLAPRSRDDVYSFLCTPEDLFTFLDEFRDTPNVGILLDIAHLNVAARLLSFDKHAVLERLVGDHGDRIFAVHLSENDGSKDHHGITDIDSWQLGFLKANRDRFKNINVVFEWQRSASKEAFEKFELIRGMLDA